MNLINIYKNYGILVKPKEPLIYLFKYTQQKLCKNIYINFLNIKTVL